MELFDILTALVEDPKLYMELKDFMLTAKVAGPWEPFNESAEAKRRRVGWGGDCTVRFTPVDYGRSHSTVSGVVVRVWKDWGSRGSEKPDPHDYDEGRHDEDYQKDLAEWEAAEERRKTHPWAWQIEYGYHFEDYPRGDGVTKHDAMRAADRALRLEGWSFPDNVFNELAEAGEEK